MLLLYPGELYRLLGASSWPVRFLLPVCRLSWLLYTFNIHCTCICTFFVAFFSATIDDRNLIFGHKLHIGTPYRGKRFWTHQIPTSCLPTLLIFIHIEHTFCMPIFSRIFLSNYWWQKSDIWSQASYRYPILWEAFLDPSDSYFLFAEERGYHKWALAHSSSCFIDCIVLISDVRINQKRRSDITTFVNMTAALETGNLYLILT